MISSVWAGIDRVVTQPWGATSLLVEPYWKEAQEHWHCGVDIALYSDTPLYAARAGKIVSVGWGQLGIDVATAPFPQVDWYIHIDRAVVSVGQRVPRGHLVAYSGNKVPNGGVTFGPHLHFEVQAARPPTYNIPESSLDPDPILVTGVYAPGSFAMLTDAEEHELLAKVRIIHAGLFGQDAAAGVPLPGGGSKPIQDALADIRNGVASAFTADAASAAAIQAALADLTEHANGTADPTLAAKIDALAKHLGVGTA